MEVTEAMEGGGKYSGGDGGASKVLGDNVQGSCTCSDPVWEQKMGGRGINYKVTGRFFP